MDMMFLAAATLVGAALGLRLNPLALVPAIAIAATLMAAAGLVCGDPLSKIVLSAIVAAVVLQLGYFAGAVGKFLLLPLLLRGGTQMRSPTAKPVR
jgi:hypothetical protein